MPEPPQRQSISSLPDDSVLPPPMSQSSGIVESRTKKRKCSKEEQEDPTNSTDTSSLIPNSQECVDISSNNVLHGKRQRKKRF